ncbi:MAG TPA: methyltransferase domain-containing protein, partial [Thermoanaerobaculia bacterium]|nr:methyltransferase domain-containing protein [Thermoanaerobaculia bacterium]
AERTIRGRFPHLPAEFLRVDMDRDFPDQGIASEIADVVYAVNTVHIAKDLAATLRRIRLTLKPGGTAVFSECIRPFDGQPIYVEFVFNFLENFTGVATDEATRPNHGFLTPENWRRAFHAAGFEEPRILPDVEELARHYDAFFVAAVSARRPRT